MTSKQKFGALQHSINQAEMGLSKIVHCPYCNTDLDFTEPDGGLGEKYKEGTVFATKDGDTIVAPTCCESFALASIAILQRKELTEAKDLASRIRSNAGGLPVFN